MNEELTSSVKPLNVLLVEGDGDIHVFGSLLNYHQIIDNNYHLQKRSDMSVESRFVSEHESKARIHTWLAWQNKPGRSMGQAITSRYVLPDAPLAQQFVLWFRRLFELETP